MIQSTDSETKHNNADPISIVFFDFCLKFDGNSIKKEPLGGAHSSLIYIARELAIKNDVIIFCKCEANKNIDGVDYRKVEKLKEYLAKNIPDIFIVMRSPEIFKFDIRAKVRILWSHDAYTDEILEPLKKDKFLIEKIDKIFCLSYWHAITFIEYLKIPREKILITRNGINKEYFSNTGCAKEKKFIYTSTPFRGLDILVKKIWSELKSILPDYTLTVFSGMAVYQFSKEKENATFGDLYNILRKDDRIDFRGNVDQKVLAQQLSRHYLYLYPNIFPETSCISVMESMYAGTPVITTSRAALPETIDNSGILINGEPEDESYRQQFIDRVVYLIENKDEYNKLRENGIAKIEKYNLWENIAEEWDRHFRIMLGKTLSYRKDIINEDYYRAFEYFVKGKKRIAEKMLVKTINKFGRDELTVFLKKNLHYLLYPIVEQIQLQFKT